MQTKKKRTETISETETILIVTKTAAGSRVRWCPQCETEAFWIELSELYLFGITGSNDGVEIHTSGGEICSRSLINEIRNGENI